jgi:outer membrane protein assembly factor BamB/predicted phosphodiesterase
VIGSAGIAGARPIQGSVYHDLDRDGVRSIGEPGVAGAVVALGIEQFVTTDGRGDFTFDTSGSSRAIAWVRVPEGFTPGPVWAAIRDDTDRIELGLIRLASPAHAPLSFVVASDTHITAEHAFSHDLAGVIAEATAIDPPPAFFTILGDITQSNKDAQFDLVDAGVAALGVPYIPVPGNHDWYDGGATWFRRYGPDNYSFDLAGVHFVVWNMSMPEADIQHYLGNELRRVPRDMTIVALSHGPPEPPVVNVLRELGVDYVLTGHTHSNRVIDHGGLIELATEPLLMGGLDFTPAGYRVITIDRSGLTTYHRTVVDTAAVTLVSPAPGQCVAAGDPLIVAAELDASAPAISARIDCGTPIELRYAGGWAWRAELPALAPGPHALTIDARSRIGSLRQAAVFEVCAAASAPDPGPPWNQLGGGPQHVGSRARELPPPLVTRWASTVGGQILHAAPAIAGDTVYAVATDLGDGTSGGVVAFDLATGAIKWRFATPLPVRGGPLVSAGKVIVAQIDGTLIGIDENSGSATWHHELAGGDASRGVATFAPPSGGDGELSVGNELHVSALDASDGAPIWTSSPGTPREGFPALAAIATSDGVSVGVFDRAIGGLIARDLATGNQLWRVQSELTFGVHASPVIAGDTVFIVNGMTDVAALELSTGALRWQSRLDPSGFEWGNATIGTPAFADGILVVPTLYRDLVALDAASGAELWRFAGTPSAIRATHYRGAREPGFAASPVITGDLVWAVDTAGHLTALELRRGRPLWSTDLGVPVIAGLAVSGDWLIVASYDGTIRALTATARERPAISAPRCEVVEAGGCCDAGAARGDAAVVAIVIALVTYGPSRRRLRRRRRSTNITPTPTGHSPPAVPALHA